MSKQRIAIIGSCISRDVFNEKNNEFEVESYFNFCSLLSWYMRTSSNIKLANEEIGHSSQWFNKCIAADINKSIIEDTIKEKPDWIIIDLMSERLDTAKCKLNNESIWLTMHNDLKKTELYKNNNLIIGEEIMRWENLDDGRKNIIIKSFCESLLEYFPSEKIIFIESFYVKSYIDKCGNIRAFDEDKIKKKKIVNNRLLEIENLMIFYLKINNVIKFPYNQLGDELHHLHLSPCHYLRSYYLYVFEELKRIVTNTCNINLYDFIIKSNDEICNLLNREK